MWGLAQPTASAFRRVALLVICAVMSAVIGITQVRVGLFPSTPVNLTSRIAGRRKHGAMAQLVAHLLCKQGVRGSSPLSSTISDVLEHLTSTDVRCLCKGDGGFYELIRHHCPNLFLTRCRRHSIDVKHSSKPAPCGSGTMRGAPRPRGPEHCSDEGDLERESQEPFGIGVEPEAIALVLPL